MHVAWRKLTFFLVQVPAFLAHSNDSKAALYGGIVCLSMLALYCFYHVRCT